MLLLDVTVVNVALPPIQHDLGFSATSLSWVVNGYTVTYGGLLMLGGRMGEQPAESEVRAVREPVELKD